MMTIFNSYTKNYALAVFLVLLGAVYIGAAELVLWSQVTDIWYLHFVEFGWPEIDKPVDSKHVVNGYPFILRQLVTYPFFAFALLLNIDPNTLYSFSLPFAATSVVWCIARTAEILSGRTAGLLAISLLIPITLLFFFMSGRIPFALAGFSLVLYCQLGLQDRLLPVRVFLASLGLLLSSVATGTMILTFTTIVMLDGYRFLARRRPSEFITSFVCLLWAGLPMFWIIDKTVRYFLQDNGSLWGMLNHGFGQLFIKYFDATLLIGGSVIALICFVVCIRILPRYFPVELLLIMAATLMAGVLGFSMLAVVVVPTTSAAITAILNFTGSTPQ